MNTRGRRWSLVLVLALLLAACGDSGDGGDESTAGGRVDEQGAAGGAQAPSALGSGATGAAPASGASGGSTSATPLTAPREVIYTASIDVRVAEVEASITDAQQLVTGAGGYLFSRQSSSADGRPRATLVFKVPPDVFLVTLDRLGSLGDEQGRVVKADDVSAQVVDLESRLKIAQASVDRTRELLARASTVTEIVTLERELAARETTLEQLQGQIRVVRGQIAAGTVTLNLAQDTSDLRSNEDDDDLPSPMDGLRAGGRALVGTAQVATLVLFTLAPWLPVIVAALWLTRRAMRHLDRRRAAALAARPARPDPVWPYRSAPPPPPAPPAPVGHDRPADATPPEPPADPAEPTEPTESTESTEPRDPPAHD